MEKNDRVPVNKIIPFSCVDGPGSRTAVFLQGCNLDCRYCHNPETRTLCIQCGLCVKECPKGALKFADGAVVYDPKLCVLCDTCIKVCRQSSSPRISYMTPAEVYQEIKKQIPFIRGITVSGGECMLYPQFLEELFLLCKKDGLHTLIDSNGTVGFWQFAKLLEVTDGVMLDVKAYCLEEHQKVTGAGNEVILKNLEFLTKRGKLYEIRTVIVPGLFDAAETVKRAASALANWIQVYGEQMRQIPRYKLISYREAGVREQYRFYQPPSREFMEQLERIARQEGIRDVVIVG